MRTWTGRITASKAILYFLCCIFVVHLIGRQYSTLNNVNNDYISPAIFSELFGLQCPKTIDVVNGDDINSLEQLQDRWRHHYKDEQVLSRMDKCEVTEKAPARPAVSLAFGITVNEGLGPLEMLVGLLSRPGHTVCIHVDAKSPQTFHDSVAKLVSCFRSRSPDTSIFTVPNPVKTYWGHVSLLMSDLSCIDLALERSQGWKYFLNMASTALPAFDMGKVEGMLAGLRGRSATCGIKWPKYVREKTAYVHTLEGSDVYMDGHLTVRRTNVPKSAPPLNLTIFKSYREVVINRTLAAFVLRSPASKALLAWLSDATCAEEMYFATLKQLRVTTGQGMEGPQVTQDLTTEACEVEARYSLWSNKGRCHGLTSRGICQLSVRDFPAVSWGAREAVFVNKFNVTHDALAAACWAERVRGRG